MNKFPRLATIALASLVLATGCKTNEKARVHIGYEQLANYYTWKLSPDAFSSGNLDDGIYVMYRINSIANTGSEAASFSFTKEKLHTITPDGVASDTHDSMENNLFHHLSSVTVPAGQTLSPPNGLGCVIVEAKTNDPQSLLLSLVDLGYSISKKQPVTMTRAPGDTTTAAVGEALPGALNGLCPAN